MTTQRIAVENVRSGFMGKAGFNLQALQALSVPDLTNAQRAKLLNVPVAALTTAIVLTPGAPRSGKNFLTMFSDIMTCADPRASNDAALFTSQYRGPVFPGVQVEYQPIKAGSPHLVEFYVTLNDLSKKYDFRIFQYPLDNILDVSLQSSQVISTVIEPIQDFDFAYGAALHQMNAVSDAAGWILRKVRITAVA